MAPQPLTGFKKRRLQGSCDLCRTKKIRCDSAKMPGNICSNCRAFGSTCTHTMSSSKKKRIAASSQKSPPTASPNLDFDFAKTQITAILSASVPYALPADPLLVIKTLTEVASYARALEIELKKQNQDHTGLYPLGSAPSSRLEQNYPNIDVEVLDSIKRLELLGIQETFMGEESQLALLKEAVSIRSQYTPEQKGGAALKRPEFWDYHPWQKLHDPVLNVPPLKFPDTDLLWQLVDFYFLKRNGMALLHRPTFEQGLRDGLHERERDFGELVLSVCGLGAQYSDDPRALADGTDSKHSLGWKYYSQIVLMQDLSRTTALYRLQIIINAIMFLTSSSKPGLCWPLLGLGVRFAQIVGAHRRSFYGRKPNPIKELWKRAFWCLVCIDTYMTSFTGRPRATNPADYDLDFPEEVDDEFWFHSNPEQAFKQPTGKPSKLSGWIHLLKLLDIFGVAQRTIHAVRKSHRWASDTSGEIISELDTALKTWVDTIPDHLKWDPNRDLFFTQSAVLYVDFYWVQIQIHRGGIKHSVISYSSLAVCTNAARSCVSVLAVLHSRGGHNAFPNTITALSNCCIILLLNLWSAKRLGTMANPIRDMSSINLCLEILKSYEPRWQNAGRNCDLISELISASNTAIPTEVTTASLTRSGEDSDNSNGAHRAAASPSSSSKFSAASFPSSSIAGPSSSSGEPSSSELAEFASGTVGLQSLPSAFDFDFNSFEHGLPLHAEDLGRLPIHFMTGVEPGASGFDTQAEGAGFYTPTEYPGYNINPMASYLHTAYDSGGFGSNGNDNSMNMQVQAAMFHDSPRGYEWDDWGTYIAAVDELLNALNPSPSNQNL